MSFNSLLTMGRFYNFVINHFVSLMRILASLESPLLKTSSHVNLSNMGLKSAKQIRERRAFFIFYETSKKYCNVSTSTINFGLILPIYTIYYIWNSLPPGSIHQARIWRQSVFRLCQISSLSSVLKTVEIFKAFKLPFMLLFACSRTVDGFHTG